MRHPKRGAHRTEQCTDNEQKRKTYMKKTLIAALIVTAGMGGQVFAQGTATGPNFDGWGFWQNPSIVKVGLLNFSLNNQFQAFNKGATWGVTTTPNRGVPVGGGGLQPWDNFSYDAIAKCEDQPTKYLSATKSINNAYIISSINAAFSRSPTPGLLGTAGGLFKVQGPANNRNPYYGSAFTSSAKIVVINNENQLAAPPYPPTEDSLAAYTPIGTGEFIANAPWNLLGLPDANLFDGDRLSLKWPNQNYISWGKPRWDLNAVVNTWIGAKVYLIDPNNRNPLLQCFDVTPFFALEESFCYFCWDTADRVTDGKIQGSTSVPPCSQLQACGSTGSGVTKFYWTVKFNSVGDGWRYPNSLLDWYYGGILAVDPTWYVFSGNISDNGTVLNDSDYTASQNSLVFTVNGLASYSWAYKQNKYLAANAPIGTTSMSASGHGYSPMCGVFTGPVSLVDYWVDNAIFKNSTSKTSVLCF